MWVRYSPTIITRNACGLYMLMISEWDVANFLYCAPQEVIYDFVNQITFTQFLPPYLEGILEKST